MIVSCPSCQRNYVVADEQIAGKQFRARCKSCGVEFRLDGTPSREASGDSPPEPAKFMSATEAYLALQTAPPPSGGNWSVCLSQTDTRRMTTDEVVQALSKGTIANSVFIWKNGMPKWLRLSDVPELMAAAGKSGSRNPQAVVVAEAAAAAKAGASKPAPPNRFGSTIIGSQPPPPIPGTGISARSGQTAPPPPMVTEFAEVQSESSSKGPAAGAVAVRRSTPAPPRRATLDIPVEVDLSPPVEASSPPVVAAPPAAGSASAPAVEQVSPPAASNNAPPSTESASAPAVNIVAAVTGGGVVLPPLSKDGKNPSAAAGAAAAIAVSKWPVQKKQAYDSKSASKSPAAEVVPSSTSTSSRPPPEPVKRKSFAGAVVAMGAVGIVGILGGVAGAVYVMKSAMGNMPQASASLAVVALQPQPATPIPSLSPVPGVASVAVAGDIATPTGGKPVIDGDTIVEPNQAAGKAKLASVGGHVVATGSKVVSRLAEPKAAEPKAAEPKAAEPKAAASKPNFAELPSLPPAAEPKPKAEAAAPASGGAKFNRDTAMAVLGMAASRAASCKKSDGPTGSAKVYVTFDPSGSVVIANVVGAPIAGTGVAQCVANLFRRVKVPAFSGDRASLAKDFTIP